MNFVTGRKYHLVVDGKKTGHIFEAGSSVPQGSCLGPVLFNIYINYMDEIFTNSQTNLLQYADDSKFYRGISNYGDMFE